MLHKHPDHVHTREFPFGNATVFYPEATEDVCTAAMPPAVVVAYASPALPSRSDGAWDSAVFRPR